MKLQKKMEIGVDEMLAEDRADDVQEFCSVEGENAVWIDLGFWGQVDLP